MTTRVCSEVPEATFVSAHAASNFIHRNLVSTSSSHLVTILRKDNIAHATGTMLQSSHLQRWEIASLQKLHKPRDDALADYLLNGRVTLCKSGKKAYFKPSCQPQLHRSTKGHSTLGLSV